MANQSTFVHNGFVGSECFADTLPHAPPSGRANWKGILVVNDAVFTTLTGNMRNSAAFCGPTIKAGFVVPGTFSTFTLASGVVLGLDDVT